MPNEFTIEAKLDRPAVLAGRTSEVYSLVTIQPNMERLGVLLESGVPSLPAHLVVIVDVSDSMKVLIEPDPKAKIVSQRIVEGDMRSVVETTVPTRLVVAMRVVQKLVERMDPTDRMTLVAFDDTVFPLAEAMPPGPALQAIVATLANMGGGGTRIGRAFENVRKSLLRTQTGERTEAVTRRIVLLTDGEDHDPFGALKEAQRLGSEYHVPIVAFGLGESHADFLMDVCKTTLGGSFDDIRSEHDAEDCFSKFLTGQKNILATKVSLQLWLAPEIYVRELYRTKPELLFVGDLLPDASNSVPIAIEYMERGKRYEFLFRSKIAARDPGRFRLAKATLTYDVPALGISEERVEANIVVEYTSDEGRAQVRSGDVRKVIADAETQQQLLHLNKMRELLITGKATEKDRTEIAKLLDGLVKKFKERGDAANENLYRQLQTEYAAKGDITQEMMNRSLAASSKVDGGLVEVDIEF